MPVYDRKRVEQWLERVRLERYEGGAFAAKLILEAESGLNVRLDSDEDELVDQFDTCFSEWEKGHALDELSVILAAFVKNCARSHWALAREEDE